MAELSGFFYRAADEMGQRVDGTVQADGIDAATTLLASRGLRVFQIRPSDGAAGATASPPGPMTRASGRISTLQRVWLFDELATLLEAGIVLVEAIDGLRMSEEHSALGKALSQVNVRLRSGATLSAALRDSALGLPRYVTELVQAGESTGRLASAARAAAQQQLAEHEFAREVRNALTYPAVLMGSGILAMLVVFVFVVPKFASILDNPKADLPLVSLWVLHGGVWLANHLVGVGAALGAMLALGVWVARRPSAQMAVWEAAGKLPLSKAWVLDAELYRWSSMLALLTQNRVSLLEALSQANATLRTRSLAAKGDRVADAVRQGRSLAVALGEQGLLERSALSLIRVGEKSGTLERCLTTLAGRYRTASQQRIKRFLVLLEPVTILVISVVLGGIMISVILAVTSLTNVIG